MLFPFGSSLFVSNDPRNRSKTRTAVELLRFDFSFIILSWTVRDVDFVSVSAKRENLIPRYSTHWICSSFPEIIMKKTIESRCTCCVLAEKCLVGNSVASLTTIMAVKNRDYQNDTFILDFIKFSCPQTPFLAYLPEVDLCDLFPVCVCVFFPPQSLLGNGFSSSTRGGIDLTM
jgi:hypothetical protein